MRILLSFMNGVGGGLEQVPCYYEAFIRGLVDAGNDVLVYCRTLAPCPPQATGETLAAVRAWQPELIIAFNNFGLDWASFCDCPILVYEVDSPICYGNMDSIRATPDRYEFLVLQETSRRILMDDFGVPSSKIFFTTNFTAVRPEVRPFARNIIFVGSRFWSPAQVLPWTEFRARNPSVAEIEQYRQMLASVAEDPFQTESQLAGRYPSVAPGKSGLEKIIAACSSEKRVRLMSALADLGLEIYGTPDWAEGGTDPSAITLSYRSRKVFSLADNQELYNSSRICVNVNHVQAVSTFSWRVYDIMASRGCLVAEDRPDVHRLFPNVPIPTFENEYEARETCKRLLADENERQDIVAACNAAIEQGCRFDRIMSALEASAGKCLRSSAQGSLAFLPMPTSMLDISPRRKSPHYALNGFRLMLSAIPGLGRCVNREKVLQRLGVGA